MEKRQNNVSLAVVAGFFATIGSLFGKLSGTVQFEEPEDLGFWLTWLMKGILLILMITSNTIGCTYFVKALNGSKSSLPTTVISNATSYMCSAIVGFLIFGESTSICWYCGIIMILFGLILIGRDPSKDTAQKVKDS